MADQKIVKDERGQEQPADKKRAAQASALEGPAAYAPGNEDQKRAEKVELAPAAPGDDRTPEKPIGQVAYADKSGQAQGGAGKPQTTSLEPEKQGGIGGP